jgi:hypothetical protein
MGLENELAVSAAAPYAASHTALWHSAAYPAGAPPPGPASEIAGNAGHNTGRGQGDKIDPFIVGSVPLSPCILLREREDIKPCSVRFLSSLREKL